MGIYEKSASQVAKQMVNMIKSNALTSRVSTDGIRLSWIELEALLSAAFEAGCLLMDEVVQR